MVKGKKVSCVVVNYNDSGAVKKLAEKITGYSCLDAVVVVDNHSTDDSLWQLRELEKDPLNGGKIAVLASEKNGGYGAGNNLGISYSRKQLGADYVLIANPDVEFSERLVYRLACLLEGHPKLGAASALMEDPVYGKQKNGWPLFGLWGDLARSGPILRRLFGKFLEYRDSYFAGKKAVYVDAVHGSLLMVDAEKMQQCGGYDERIFLYNEEAVLGTRMRRKGFRTALLLTDTYVHRHSESIGKTYGKMWERQKIRNRSAYDYYTRYLQINRMQELAVRAFFQVVGLEIRLFGKIKEVLS